MAESASAKEAEAPHSKAYSICMILFAIFNFLGFVGIIVGYFVFMNVADTTLKEATEICSNNADAISIMEDVPSQLVEFWAYNISNPHEYINGGNAEVNEVGTYGFNFLPELNNIEANQDTMEFDLYNKDIRFNKQASCDTCEPSNEIFSQFTPYSGIMGAARNEAVAMLSMSCTLTQIGLIQSPNPNIKYCETSQMRTGTMCRCCAPTPTVNATTCSAIASTSSRNGGIISWLAKYDGGVKISATPNANFPLSTGVYTGLVRTINVQEVALGTASTMMGFFGMTKALTDGNTAAKTELAKITNDMKDACTPLGYCPTMNQLLQQILANPTPQNLVAVIRSIDCSGLIPSAEVLESEYNVEHSRALELRYLEGTNCRSYGQTLAMSTLIRAQQGSGSTHTCADSSHTLPCCMSAFSAPAIGGAGQAIGCLGWSSGVIQVRNLYSIEEAIQYIEPGPHAKSYTACAEESMRFRQEMWHGRSEWNSWFTPETYVYPNMNWADFSIVSGALAATVAGNFTVYDIEGTQMALRKGRGITTEIFDYDLTDGQPTNKREDIWAPFRLAALSFEHVESFEYQGLQVAYMKPYIQTDFTDAEIESRQRKGEMPYPNQKNVAYVKGIPVVLGYPNFYKVNPVVLSQSSNAARFAPPGAEIQLYRTRAGYHPESPMLTVPERITTDTLVEFGEEYEGDLVIEPASGITLDAAVVTMVSNFVWQCDPRLDATCQLMASAYNAANPLCYNFGNGKQMPCSVTNVFTPKVHGGKVMPIAWIRSLAVPSADLVDILLDLSDTRYSLSIAVIILPVVFFVGFVFAVIQIKAIYFPSEYSSASSKGLHQQNSFGDNNDNKVELSGK